MQKMIERTNISIGPTNQFTSKEVTAVRIFLIFGTRCLILHISPIKVIAPYQDKPYCQGYIRRSDFKATPKTPKSLRCRDIGNPIPHR